MNEHQHDGQKGRTFSKFDKQFSDLANVGKKPAQRDAVGDDVDTPEPQGENPKEEENHEKVAPNEGSEQDSGLGSKLASGDRRYHIYKLLGQGGQGKVYAAWDRQVKRFVAIKLLKPKAQFDPGGTTGGGILLREVQKAAEAGGGPNVVTVYDLVEQDSQLPFIVMEYAAGGTLEERKEECRKSVRDLILWLQQVASGLTPLHANRRVHRDIKPVNILLVPAVPSITDGTNGPPELPAPQSFLGINLVAKLADFGIAGQTGEPGGHTPGFAAPEVIISGIHSTQSDVFALGATACYLLIGRAPGIKAVGDVYHPPTEAEFYDIPGMNRDLVAVILKAVAENPNSRYLSAGEMGDDLGRFLRGDHVKVRRVGLFEAVYRWARRKPTVAALLAAVMMTILVASVLIALSQKATHASGLVKRLFVAEWPEVPRIIEDLDDYRPWTDPLLRDAYAEAEEAGEIKKRQQLRASLALLPVDPKQADYLFKRLLDAEPPAVGILVAGLSEPEAKRKEELWAVVRNPRNGGERLRAACALAKFDPKNPSWAKVRGAVAADMVTASSVDLGTWMEALRHVGKELLPPLSTIFRDDRRRETERSLATDLLVKYAANQPKELSELLVDADDKQFAVLFPLLKGGREGERGEDFGNATSAVSLLSEKLKTPLESMKTDEEKERLAKQQANAAVALLEMGQPERVWPLLRHRPDPRVRSYLTDRLALLGAKPATLYQRIEQEKEVSILRALLLSLGEFDLARLHPSEAKQLLAGAWQMYQQEFDAGIHGAAEWLLRRWKQQDRIRDFEQEWAADKEKRKAKLEHIRRELARENGRGEGYWYTNGQGQTMVVVPGPVTFRMGSLVTEAGRVGGPPGKFEMPHSKQIGRTFAIAAHEVTVGQFCKFRKDHDYNKMYSPSDDHPTNSLTWFDAAAYCNWLSDQEGIPEKQWCYEPRKGYLMRDWSAEAYGEGMKLKENYLSLEGYRLPSEAEWEFACRAGASTSRYYGETAELLGKYAWYSKNTKDGEWMQRVGSLKPNDLGLFDMLGNAAEWTQDRVADYPLESGQGHVSDCEQVNLLVDFHPRIVRGGSFSYQHPYVRSAYRYKGDMMRRNVNIGFRLAKTVRLR